ncbi:HPr kinase/phosphorylase [Erythrobacter litoralis]|uniref:HPr kinase/phosphorylase C-terminal domain-containing protein n=1 Tax=Erythrobacter litoralis (strain HTCC2594) TaxID=314225 RepID=Q2NCS4_ERYLH|nr:HPr kinase/phosphatase C-terminal domain-containing protein [Erythrobacter litoralis]ABC62517.1 hypothetical protein ELI_02125 [Erythrobacter litoralis HTCC2594]
MLYQASCVAIGGRAVLIEGPPGAGKTSLALALIDRGASLVGDDGVRLERRGTRLFATPPPNIAGRIEIRNVGIVHLPCVEAPVALLLRLDPDAPRYIEGAESETLGSVPIPRIAFASAHAADAIRAEYALRLHGIDVAG